jgi:hypothetical protein
MFVGTWRHTLYLTSIVAVRSFYHVGKAETVHSALAEDPGDDLGHVVHVEVHHRAAACQYNCQKQR